jgi:hypothetical protein
MLRNLAAYLIAFVIAPIFAGLSQFLLLPLTLPLTLTLMPKAKDGNPRTPARVWSYALLSGLTCIARGLATIWFARVVFAWFRVEPTVAVAWALGAGFALNHLGALRASNHVTIIPEFTETVGDLLGVILGATYLLSHAPSHP